jgi:hypothetical protein
MTTAVDSQPLRHRPRALLREEIQHQHQYRRRGESIEDGRNVEGLDEWDSYQVEAGPDQHADDDDGVEAGALAKGAGQSFAPMSRLGVSPRSSPLMTTR